MRLGSSSRVFCAFGLAALLLATLGTAASALPAQSDETKIALRSYLPTALPQCLPTKQWSGATRPAITETNARKIVQSWSSGGRQLTDVVRIEPGENGIGDMVVLKRTLVGSGKPKLITMEARAAKHPDDAYVRMTQRSGKSLGPDHLEAWLAAGVDVEGAFEGSMPRLGEILAANQQGKRPELSTLGGKVVAAINEHIHDNKAGKLRQDAMYAGRYCKDLDAAACQSNLELVPDGAHHLFGRVARPFIRQLLPVYRKLQRRRQKTTGHGG